MTIETKFLEVDFDGKKAREIRMNEGLTQRDLSFQLTGKYFGLSERISMFENGRGNRGNPYNLLDSEGVREYLRWLADRDYDPKGIFK